MNDSPTAPQDGAIERISASTEQIKQQLARVIVGQHDVIEQMLIALFSRGHCLLEGVPGLAKTLLVSTLAQSLNLSFSRIQFTPDLMPADITGTDIIEENRSTGQREMRFLAGPLFANVILADEINRTPPKTQAALLEAMQERQVTVGRVRHTAQQDRFMFKVHVSYPSFDEEFEVARRTTSAAAPQVEAVLSPDEILHLQQLVREVPISDHLVRYALALVRQTRVREPAAADVARDQLAWGAGPRAVQFLILGAKARALIRGRAHVAVDDIQELAKPVLRHRLVVNFAAESDGITSDHVVERLLEITPTHEDQLIHDDRFQKIFAS
jgi:MoxR-like ATPase